MELAQIQTKQNSKLGTHKLTEPIKNKLNYLGTHKPE
jgi:hypothetical protein